MKRMLMSFVMASMSLSPVYAEDLATRVETLERTVADLQRRMADLESRPNPKPKDGAVSDGVSYYNVSDSCSSMFPQGRLRGGQFTIIKRIPCGAGGLFLAIQFDHNSNIYVVSRNDVILFGTAE